RGAAGGPPGATRAGREARFTGAPPPAGDDPARLPRYLVAVIRRASVADHDWIAAIAAEVYGALGDYGTIIRSWLEHPGVLAYLDEVPGEAGDPLRRGFTLVGFYEPAGTPPGTYVADLLAIAVAPAHQRRGVGKGLLEHAIHLAEGASRGGRIHEMRLTVAVPDAVALRLFPSFGCGELDENPGVCDGGERALRMAGALTPPAGDGSGVSYGAAVGGDRGWPVG